MLKKHMAACLVVTAFAALPAFAQTQQPSGATDRPTATGTGTTSSGSSAMQPNATGAAPAVPAAPSAGQAMPAAPSAGQAMPAPAGNATNTASLAATAAAPASPQGQFPTQLQGNQMMASKLIGSSVVSTNSEAIGDVNDVILDRNGQVMAVVVGVGGFLGIGEKDVAVPFQALDFNAAPGRVSSDTNPTAVNGPTTTGSTDASQHETASNRQTATTGNTGNAGRSATAGAANSNDNAGGVPNRLVLKMTKADLQAAPTFNGADRGTVGTGSGDPAASSSNAGRQ